MLEIVLQFFREILMEIPGAFIRWIFLSKHKTLKEIISEGSPYNYLFSYMFISFLVFIIVVFK
ncbi:hypothetical protein DFQ07_1895 [Tenacibaculum caenipelagi]|uniref:Uncharacterized protein n=1 Tax=Tenacibaculum caenipelagi TaxID=1325435 RepID=A0A4R6TBX0_9FLAO|nr:hypothetical protein DFQ07_1895 [Tenacibaculum caenipelagi]